MTAKELPSQLVLLLSPGFPMHNSTCLTLETGADLVRMSDLLVKITEDLQI